MRLAFMGTPQFAVPTLQALLHSPHRVVAVFTQPDKPAGRGGKVAFSPVKQLALSHHIPVLQPEKLRKEEGEASFRFLDVEALVVVAYGKILPTWLIQLPPRGALNLHASLLPQYRGAAPINWVIVNGETVTGVTTMQIDAGMDTGDILMQTSIEIGKESTASELHDRLAGLGAELMVKTLALAERNELRAIPQDSSLASYAPLLKKEDGLLSWEQSAQVLDHRIRGLNPWPGTVTRLGHEWLRIWRAAPIPGFSSGQRPGTLMQDRQLGAIIQCLPGGLQLMEVQWENRKRITGQDLLHGLHMHENDTVLLGR